MRLFKLLTMFFAGLVTFSSTAIAEKKLLWHLVDAHYTEVIGCESPRATATLNWGNKVISNSGPKDIAGRKIDATVQYESSKHRFAVGSWTRPFYEPQTGQIVMHLSAVDLRGGTTLRVFGKAATSLARIKGGPQAGGTQLSRAISALVAPYGSGSATLLIKRATLSDDEVETAVVTVSASDGGTCGANNFAVYTFRKNADSSLLVKRAEAFSWAGTWKTQWGPITFAQDGNRVSGQYTEIKGKQKGQLKGFLNATVSGTTLKGTWSYAESYRVSHKLGMSGDIEFNMDESGKKFKGRYGYNQKGWYGKWNGTRTEYK